MKNIEEIISNEDMYEELIWALRLHYQNECPVCKQSIQPSCKEHLSPTQGTEFNKSKLYLAEIVRGASAMADKLEVFMKIGDFQTKTKINDRKTAKRLLQKYRGFMKEMNEKVILKNDIAMEVFSGGALTSELIIAKEINNILFGNVKFEFLKKSSQPNYLFFLRKATSNESTYKFSIFTTENSVLSNIHYDQFNHQYNEEFVDGINELLNKFFDFYKLNTILTEKADNLELCFNEFIFRYNNHQTWDRNDIFLKLLTYTFCPGVI